MKWLNERLARARSESGVTLIELVVVCAVMTVILGFVTRTLVVMQNASTGSSLRLQNLDEARVLMDLVSKDIRTAGRMTPTTSPFDVTACTATLPVAQTQPCAPAGWTPGGNPAPYVGKSELWFYANITLANQTQASPCPDIVHLFVDSTVNPPVLKEQTISDANPTTDAPPNCRYGGASAPYTGTWVTRLVGKYIVNGTSSCITPDPVFVYWYDDASGNPVSYTTPATSLVIPTQTSQVNAVGITFAIRQSTNFKVPCATLVNRVRLANVDYNPIPSPVP
jgi:type II secretory pathway pseudopilin PulG